MKSITFGLVSLIFVGFLARVLPHPPNFTPIIAMALLSSVFLEKKWIGILIAFVALFASDLIINNTIYAAYYEGFSFFGSPATYLGISLVALLPILFKTNTSTSLPKLGALGISGALSFFAISNIMVWATSGMYPMNIAGLIACLTAGLPFLLNTVLSTLLFGGIGIFTLRLLNTKDLRLQRVKSR